ncbi:MAG: hypothetical protein OJF49_001616 [Ktedonobacterales bacterium]|jgi:hypothetical protein|nr:MAG: hypothetical protein OJF49_001616 [Ktedonobacterales bacterium]
MEHEHQTPETTPMPATHSETTWAEQDRERRLDALRALAQQEGASAGMTPADSALASLRRERVSLRPPRSGSLVRSRRGLALLSALLAVVVLVAGTGIYLRFVRHTPAPTVVPHALVTKPLAIDTSKYGVPCPMEMVWSPDGKELAIRGAGNNNASSCYGPNAPAAIAIVAAHSGTLLRQIPVAQLLTRFGATVNGIGGVDTFTWTPDGRALIFLVNYDPSLAIAPPRAGLLIVPVADGDAQFIDGPKLSYPALTFHTSLVWDLQQHAVASINPDALSPAVSYRWSANGHLVVDTALPASPTGGYTGSPVTTPAATTIPFWQPGTLRPVQALDKDGNPPADGSTPPSFYLYDSAPTLWSPDGRFLVFTLALAGLLPSSDGKPLQPDSRACHSYRLMPACTSKPVPYPDPAFAAAAKLIRDGIEQNQHSINATLYMNGFTVAWRPDGKLLAVMLPGDGFDGNGPTITITLYSTATGQVVAKLKADRPAPNGSLSGGDAPFFAWSPTGKQLAVVDYFSSRVTIWGESLLPA